MHLTPYIQLLRIADILSGVVVYSVQADKLSAALYTYMQHFIIMCVHVQVCARCLGVPPEAVFISETSTDTVPNSTPTAASMSTDLYGMAVKVGTLVARVRLFVVIVFS